MFSLDQFIADARSAATAADPVLAVKLLMHDVLSDPADVAQNMPDMAENEVLLFEDETVSIWHERFLHTEILPPHDHQMDAILGVYHGRERNLIFQKMGENVAPGGVLELSAGQFHHFGPDDIHTVQGLDGAPSLGLHIYLGPLTQVERSLYCWDTGKPLPMCEASFLEMVRPT